jgi:DNA-binding beta-propeller fold protein YncE
MNNKATGCFFCLLAFMLTGRHTMRAAETNGTFDATTETVGPSYHGFIQNQYVTPVNQLLTPAGIQIELPAFRPNALALSPDHSLLVTAGLAHQLLVVGTQTGKILQQVPFPSGQASEQAPVSAAVLDRDGKARLSFNGLAFSPDGTRIYLANVNGDIKVFVVAKDKYVSPLFSITLPPANAPGRKPEIPAGLAVSRDGKRLYVALNLSNRLAELDATTGKLLRLWNVGVAPFDVVVAGKKIYVSNWGGRRPAANDLTGPAGLGTRVRVDPVRSVASEGSVSVIDLAGTNQTEIVTGLHACALALSPNGKYVVVSRKPRWRICVIRCSRRRNCRRARKSAARPVPERAGEPSVFFQHVIYIIKENRTYDQVLGDVKPATATRTCASSASASRRTSTSSSAILCCSTTPIAAAF